MRSNRLNSLRQPLLWHQMVRSPLLNLIVPTVLFATGFAHSTQAQIVPDRTLGAEGSVVTPDVTIRGIVSDRIDGGAVRGINLFHSFQQFNVGAGRGAYFSNPVGVENILSRVTGGSRSDILGRLGVLGNANLFLINPNGIVFGPDASLDVAGSFTATTADAIALGEQGLFSATQPERSNLLAVAPGALFAEQLARQGTIRNAGNLTAGRDLTLAAGTLDLEGSIQSGANLTLQGWDTVRIRDRVTRPFVAAAGGQLVVQGDRAVDIFALNHPTSGLFSGGSMVLRSANTVSGDAHYWSGGVFRIERLDGTAGNLYSPYDPIVLAFGDVLMDSYTGGSLHILAGGSVTVLGNITITGADANALITPGVLLSDNTFIDIDGTRFPTLDIRAGFDWASVGGFLPAFFPGITFPAGGTFSGFPLFPLFNLIPTNADILILGTISNNFDDSRVFLSNYNPLRLSGSIATGQIDAFGGSVVIDANDFLFTSGINTSRNVGNAGEIRLLALAGLGGIDTRAGTLLSVSDNGNAGNVTIRSLGNIATADIRAFVPQDATGLGGNITLQSTFGSIDTTAGTLFSSTTNGDSGNVTLTALGNITTAGIESLIGFGGSGSAGDITLTSILGAIDTRRGNITSLVGEDGVGLGGDITLDAFSNILTADVASRVSERGVGVAGDISLRSVLGGIDTTAGTLSSSTDDGISGKITLDAFGDIFTGNVEAFSTGAFVGQAGEISITSVDGAFFLFGSSVTSQASGAAVGGNITVSARSVFLDQAIIASSTFGQGDAGELISIFADNVVSLENNSQIRGTVESGGVGKASDILIQARAVLVTDGSQVQTALFRETTDPATGNILAGGQGRGGNIGVIASDLVYIAGTNSDGFSSGLLTVTERGASGPAGDISVDVGTGNFNNAGAGLFRVESGGAVVASTRNDGNGGNITINSRVFEALAGGRVLAVSGSLANPRGTTTGFAGNITVTAMDSVTIAGVDPNFQDRIDRIDRFVQTPDAQGTTRQDVLFRENDASGLFVDTQDAGRGGTISVITGGSFALTDGAQIDSSTAGQGGLADAGLVLVAALGPVRISNSTIFSSVGLGAVGNAGGILISGALIDLEQGAELQVQTGGFGNAGAIFLQTNGGTISLDNSRVFSNVLPDAVGIAGGISIETGDLSLRNQSGLTTSTLTDNLLGCLLIGGCNAGIVSVQASRTVSLDNSAIFSSVGRGAIGNAGDILITAASIVLDNQAELQVQTEGIGNAGQVFLQTNGGTVSLNRGSVIFSSVQPEALGTAGGILIDTGTLSISNGSGLTTNTLTAGLPSELTAGTLLEDLTCESIEGCNAGVIFVRTTRNVSLSNDSAIISEVGLNARGTAGGILMQVGSFSATNNSGLSTSTFGVGNAGLILLLSQGDVSLSGNDSGIFSSVGANSTSAGGGIGISARNLFIRNGAVISVNHEGETGEAGSIFIDARRVELERNARITATTLSGDGGNIELTASSRLFLRRNSNISTTAGLRPDGGSGGNITINTPFIIATPSRDSNITAQAYTGTGGVITINGIGFLGIAPRSDDFPTSNDITTSSRFGLSGITTVNALDGSFLENSLTEFPQNLIDPNRLLAHSCIVRREQEGGTFFITGSGGLPVRPGDLPLSAYPTGDVRSLEESGNQGEVQRPTSVPPALVEPQGVYRLSNGQLILSRECE